MDDRGLHVQALGFGIVGCLSVWILQWCSGLECQACNIFEVATTRVYWAFVPPLVWLLDWSRRMFERRQAIREEVARELAIKAIEAVKAGESGSNDLEHVKAEAIKQLKQQKSA